VLVVSVQLWCFLIKACRGPLQGVRRHVGVIPIFLLIWLVHEADVLLLWWRELYGLLLIDERLIIDVEGTWVDAVVDNLTGGKDLCGSLLIIAKVPFQYVRRGSFC